MLRVGDLSHHWGPIAPGIKETRASYLLGNIESGESENLFSVGMGAQLHWGFFAFFLLKNSASRDSSILLLKRLLHCSNR